MEKDKKEEKEKDEKPKKKLVLESSSIIMIVSLVIIFLVTVANKAGLLSAWITWPLLIVFLAAMIVAMFLPKREKK